jgi:hypothetical protein
MRICTHYHRRGPWSGRVAEFHRWEKGYRVQTTRSSQSGIIVLVAIAALLSMLSISCSSPRTSDSPHAQVLGDIAIALGGYTQEAASGWFAELMVTNTSATKLECVALSYAAGLPSGSMSVIATNLDAGSLPRTLHWIRREPEMQIDPTMMRRYGMGQFFDLPTGGHTRVLLPIIVPQAHPHDFVEHLVLGYRRLSTDPGAYETYVAEVKQ